MTCLDLQIVIFYPSSIGKTSYSGNKVHPRRTSYWTQDDNVVNTSTDEFELLRIRRNVSHLQLHGNYPTSYDEEHCSRTIPEFLLLRDFKEEQAAKDLEREVELAFGRQWLWTERKDFKVSRKSAWQKPRSAAVSNR